MKIAQLIQHWESTASGTLDPARYAIRLDRESAARLHALADLYPGRAVEELLADLLRAALESVETAFPYVPGPRVIATDEQGDPVYEDLGRTPDFLARSRAHLQRLQAADEASPGEP